MSENVPDEATKIARVLGQVYWRHQFTQANPDATQESRRADWAANRREYLKLGRIIMRRMNRMGYTIQKAPEKEGAA